MKTKIVSLLLVCSALAASANPYVILPGDRRIDGVSIRARADRTVLLTREDGQQFTFDPGQYVRAVGPRPDAFNQGMQLLRAGRYDDAIARFETVVRESRFLTWDERALMGMARAHEGKGNPRGALEAYDRLIELNPRASDDIEIRWGRLGALQQTGQSDQVLPEVERFIKEGEAADAARAYLVRGDIRVARNQFEEAVLDYLRTVMFFRRESQIMPAAYLRVAQTLEKMRDNRSREWYRNLVERFPDSEEAETARAKL